MGHDIWEADASAPDPGLLDRPISNVAVANQACGRLPRDMKTSRGCPFPVLQTVHRAITQRSPSFEASLTTGNQELQKEP